MAYIRRFLWQGTVLAALMTGLIHFGLNPVAYSKMLPKIDTLSFLQKDYVMFRRRYLFEKLSVKGDKYAEGGGKTRALQEIYGELIPLKFHSVASIRYCIISNSKKILSR